MGFSILGGLIAFVVPLLIIGRMRPENAGRILMVGTIFGIVSALPLFPTFFGTRERPENQERAQRAPAGGMTAPLR